MNYHGGLINGFWEGHTAPQKKRQFLALSKHFNDLWTSSNGKRYPSIPVEDASLRDWVNELDRMNFHEYLEKIVGGKLHPHIEATLEYYFWSTFGASHRELSAAAGMNSYAAEFGEIYATPGGNSGVAERFFSKTLASGVKAENFRTNSVVFDVEVDGDHVKIAYVDSAKRTRVIEAKSLIICSQKFIAAKMLQGMEPERSAAIKDLKYRAYLVANVLIDQVPERRFYDMFLLGEGKVDSRKPREEFARKGSTDVILATFAKAHPSKSVLTLYRGAPYDQGASEILGDGSFQKFHSEFEKQVFAEILPLLKIPGGSVIDLRVARWGHAMSLSEKGLIASGKTDILRKPFRDRVFFVHQDNWMFPAIETSLGEALHFAPQVEKILRA